MLSEGKLRSLNEFVDKLSREELIWINGYLSGKIYSNGLSESSVHVAPVTKKFTILYGTDTGNSKKLAIEFSGLSKREGAKVKVASMDTYKVEDLAHETSLCIIMSTLCEKIL
jgi:sulfite reductase (NADPH) flavoprotein alpha-component